MEYLKPIAKLESEVSLYRRSASALLVLLGISILGVPLILGRGPYLVVDRGEASSLLQAQPWTLTVSRIEGFTRTYLSSRFEWTAENFEDKRKSLKSVTSEAVFKSLKDSVQGFESLAKAQNAKGYFVLEGFAFANAQRRVEARFTRIVRINEAALATPLVIRMTFQEVPVGPANPYGLVVTGVEELDAAAESKGSKS